MIEQIDLFSYMSQEPAEAHAAAERDLNEPMEGVHYGGPIPEFVQKQIDGCAGCKHNRMNDHFFVCYYETDTGKKLKDDDEWPCPGYDDGLRRDESGARLNGMYYERSTGLFVSFVQGRRYFETDGFGHAVDWKKRIQKERAIE